LVFNQSGSLVNKASYSTYGVQTNSSSAATPFGFEGGYTDPSGLIYLDHRYYDPGTGQFISIDPMAGATGQPYAYTGGDPINATDPLGLFPAGPPGTGDYCNTGLQGTFCHQQGQSGATQVYSTQQASLTLKSGGPAFPAPPISVQIFSAPPPAPSRKPRASRPPSVRTMSLAEKAQWAQRMCQDPGNNCTVQSVLAAGGFMGCTVGASGGGCYPRWVSIGGNVSIQELQGSDGWWSDVVSGLDGCWEGGTTGGVAGSVGEIGVGTIGGAVIGCLIGGVVEGGGATAVQQGLRR
jgi:RHS repeat-associated protein